MCLSSGSQSMVKACSLLPLLLRLLGCFLETRHRQPLTLLPGWRTPGKGQPLPSLPRLEQSPAESARPRQEPKLSGGPSAVPPHPDTSVLVAAQDLALSLTKYGLIVSRKSEPKVNGSSGCSEKCPYTSFLSLASVIFSHSDRSLL